jgi:integrase
MKPSTLARPKHHLKHDRTYDLLRRLYQPHEMPKALHAFRHGWRKQVAFVCATLLNRRVAKKGFVGEATAHRRHEIMMLSFQQLREMGYKFEYITQFATRHADALFQRWADERLSASTITNRRTVLAFFTECIHKPGIIQQKENFARHGVDPALLARSTVTKVDKSWSGGGVDLAHVLRCADERDARIGLILRAMLAFGLRVLEAVRLQPHEADKGSILASRDAQALDIDKGTKGGRHRLVPIDTPALRALVDDMKRVVPPGDSLSGKHRKLDAALRWYYREIAKLGITKDQLGVTSHGLRHEYVHQRLAEQGVTAPVKAVKVARPKKSRDEVRQARRSVAELVGHSRPTIITAYSGSFVRSPVLPTESVEVAPLAPTVVPPSLPPLSPVPTGQPSPSAA